MGLGLGLGSPFHGQVVGVVAEGLLDLERHLPEVEEEVRARLGLGSI